MVSLPKFCAFWVAGSSQGVIASRSIAVVLRCDSIEKARRDSIASPKKLDAHGGIGGSGKKVDNSAAYGVLANRADHVAPHVAEIEKPPLQTFPTGLVTGTQCEAELVEARARHQTLTNRGDRRQDDSRSAVREIGEQGHSRAAL